MVECGCIVLNYKAAEQTIRNVDILTKNNSNVFVVIVDNCSTGNDYENMVQYYTPNPRVDVILSTENGGYSKGNNIGIKYLLHKFPEIKYIAIMNPDVRCDDKEMIFGLTQRLEEYPDMVLVAPLMLEGDKINFQKIGWQLPLFTELLLSKMYIIGRIIKCRETKYVPVIGARIFRYDTVQGSFFVIKKSIFEKMGYFDENVFMYSEENILGAKIKQMNPNAYAGVDFSYTYIHEHNYAKKSLKQRQDTIRKQYKSENYYLRRYSSLGLAKRMVLWVFGCFYINVEMPIGNALRILFKR